MKSKVSVQTDNNHLEHTLDLIPDLICRFLPDSTLLFVNQSFAQFYGKKKKELVGTQWLELLPETERNQAKKDYVELSKEQTVNTIVRPYTKTDGTTGWHEWIHQVITDKRGEVQSYLSIGKDITNSKTLKNRLQDTNKQLEQAEEVARLGSWYLNIHKNELTWSKEVFRIFSVPEGTPSITKHFLPPFTQMIVIL